VHADPVPQVLPQAPQFSGSIDGFTHDPEHSARPLGQLATHWEPTQTSPTAQALPHAPQFFGSDVASAQIPEHSRSPSGQVHSPATQVRPAPHVLPHAPQFNGSRVTSTQPLPHSTNRFEHVATHDPFSQRGVLVGQALPHDPQLKASPSSDLQTPSQNAVPSGHAHCPPLQVCPEEQALPQPPQFSGSVSTSTHAFPHATCPGAWQAHKPETQLCAAPHARPHDPQLAGSERVSEQAPAQDV
jgi:hypothetical protein